MLIQRLLTVTDVAERLSISTATVYDLIKRGKLASCRIGSARGAIRVREEDLAEYLERNIRSVKQEVAPFPVVSLRHIRLPRS